MRMLSLARRPLCAVLLLLGATLLPELAAGRPLSAWLTLSGPTSGYLSIPSAAELNPSSAITIEAWVNVSDANSGGCSSIVGKSWTQAWWLGICGTTLRSYIRGYDSTGTAVPIRTFRDAGKLPASQWTHIAVTFDGTTRRHYINGELVGSWTEPGLLTATGDAVRIGSDVSFVRTPGGAIDEVRLWNVARTQDQIRANINVPLTPQSGLVGYWTLDGPNDASGHGHNGTLTGSGVTFWTFPVAISCGSSNSTTLCLNHVLSVSAKYRTGGPGTAETQAHVAVSSANSGIFYFFAPDNWEVTVKTVDGCGVNFFYWVFLTSDTSLFYRVEVFDIVAGQNKVYFNWATLTPFSILDTQAFPKSCS